ncbi:endospore germination permease [Paenibacillus sp. GCM10023252]|uniref:GerAB/ArcD/ProY family transporter n=1 Tax=Paenibacillus sp. GCM10023252 TaxID=3252649 RepID=UPI003611CA0A
MNHYISERQAVIWFTMYYVGSSILIIPSTLASVAKQDASLSALLALGLNLAILPMLVLIGKRMQGKSVAFYMGKLIGKWPSKVLLLLFLAGFPFLIFALTLKNLGDFLTSYIIPDTPIAAVHIVFLAAVIYGVRQGVEGLGRAAEILMPFAVVMFLFLILSLMPEFHLYNLEPFLEFGVKPIIRAAVPFWAFPFMEPILFLFLIPSLAPSASLKNVFVKSSLITGITIFVVTLITIGLMGASLTTNLTYSTYFISKTIGIVEFFERIEVVIALVWFITIYFRLALLFHVCCQGMADVLGLKDFRLLLIPIGALSLPTANILLPNATYLYEFIGVWPSYAMLFGIVVPLGMLAAHYVRSRMSGQAGG